MFTNVILIVILIYIITFKIKFLIIIKLFILAVSISDIKIRKNQYSNNLFLCYSDLNINKQINKSVFNDLCLILLDIRYYINLEINKIYSISKNI